MTAFKNKIINNSNFLDLFFFLLGMKNREILTHAQRKGRTEQRKGETDVKIHAL